MKKVVSFVTIIVGVGAVVFALSDYTPGSGWSHSCRYVMAIGSMLATYGWLTR
jgi:hypothetical protein